MILTANLTDVRNAVRTIDHAVAASEEGVILDLDTTELAASLALCDSIVESLNGIAAELVDRLASMMEADVEDYGPYHVERVQSTRTSWEAVGARRAIKEAIVDHLAVDPATGEVHQPIKRAIDRALDLAWAATSSAAKASMTGGGLKALGLDPSEYTETIVGAVRVKVSER